MTSERPSLRVRPESDAWGDQYGSHWDDIEVLKAAAAACEMAGWIISSNQGADAELFPFRSPEVSDGVELRIAGNSIDLPFAWEPGRYFFDEPSISYLASMLALNDPRGAKAADDSGLSSTASHWSFGRDA